MLTHPPSVISSQGFREDNWSALQTGKSFEQAIHQRTRPIEIAFTNKEIVLAFLDAEGVFKRAFVLATDGRMIQKRAVDPVISSMSRNKAVYVSRYLCTVKAVVVVGCPQGRILLPLLWYLLVDDLLHKHRPVDIHIQGYSDDIAIIVCGKVNDVVSERIQVALQLVER